MAELYVANNGGPGWIVDAEGNSLPVGQEDDNHGRVDPACRAPGPEKWRRCTIAATARPDRRAQTT